MAYLVNITTRAQRDLARLYRQIDVANSDLALKWYRGLKQAILSLEEQPNRSP
jgi:ParE toxin of type II toxin-antitoxin system, parDE